MNVTFQEYDGEIIVQYHIETNTARRRDLNPCQVVMGLDFTSQFC